MPPRRGGRGRGGARARPPQVMRNAMADLGMGSIARFELLARAAAAQNANAARAYFPVLDPERKVTPIPLGSDEKNLTHIFLNLRKSINKSPVAIRRRSAHDTNSLEGQVSAIKRYFYPPSKTQGDSADAGSIWDLEKSWVVPEMIPPELIPSHVRQAQHRQKKRRISEDDDDDDHDDHDDIGEAPTLLGAAHDANDTHQDAQIPARADNEDDDVDPNAAEADKGEDDDDLELDADYQTGVRFDDDDGYEDPDSGAEEATF